MERNAPNGPPLFWTFQNVSNTLYASPTRSPILFGLLKISLKNPLGVGQKIPTTYRCGAQTKRPETQRPEGQTSGDITARDITSVGQNVKRDKMSGRTKRPAGKTSGRPNVRRDKTSGGKKHLEGQNVRRPYKKIRSTLYLRTLCLWTFCLGTVGAFSSQSPQLFGSLHSIFFI
jgi:hypothetical protein